MILYLLTGVTKKPSICRYSKSLIIIPKLPKGIETLLITTKPGINCAYTKNVICDSVKMFSMLPGLLLLPKNNKYSMSNMMTDKNEKNTAVLSLKYVFIFL